MKKDSKTCVVCEEEFDYPWYGCSVFGLDFCDDCAEKVWESLDEDYSRHKRCSECGHICGH